MTTAPQPANQPAASATTPTGRVARLPHESIADYFARCLELANMPGDGSAGETVYVYTTNNGTLPQRQVLEIPWPDFDEGRLALEPGRYVLLLRTSYTGKRSSLAFSPLTVEGASMVPPPASPAAGGVGSPPGAAMPLDSTALFGLILQQNQASMNAMQAQNQTLLQLALKPQQPRNMFEEVAGMLELTRKMAPRVQESGGSAIAEALREVVPMAIQAISPLLQRLGQARPQPQQPQRVETVAQEPSSPAALPAATVDPIDAIIAGYLPVLEGGARLKGDPSLYADVLKDALLANGLPPDVLLAGSEPGELARELHTRAPSVPLDWLESIEQAMREADDDDDEQEQEPLFTPDPPVPPPAPPPITITPQPPAPPAPRTRKPKGTA